ncbi:uncharacterized protein AC631_00549 [Debaryomyces fabryi]|uniref:AAA+ ATPase domain-containing protein n=1 Tax=Debaryomyces fabryi TaxID=58627 RepID=A0A0V1Q5K5_9ASCO|nr:uncharacterized protein AC631_00549 [Debaryomyces fabryi]KSA03737.1 hypothetical protein AC631_00549 [Debaryomyces fabryi]CUM53318.1 unnamed protein product [Debaryomyces fabryi]
MSSNDSVQSQLVESFKNAINLELQSDLLLTNSYLTSYSPKKLHKLGLAVINLIVTNVKNGLGGKTIIELEIDPALKSNETEIQMGSLRVGDIIRLDKMSNANTSETVQTKKAQDNSSKKKKGNGEEDNSQDESLDAVLIKINSNTITISIEEDHSEEKVLSLYNNTSNDNVRMWIVKLSNSITYKRMTSSMNKLAELSPSKKSEIIQYLLGETQYAKKSTAKSLKDKQFFNPNLNSSQKEAINFAINESAITIIHGPPGTGKTYTLIELIKQLTFNNGEKVLVCGPSNISVDTILERLSPIFNEEDEADKKKTRRAAKKNTSALKNPEKLIRIGHPARLLGNNLQHSLDILSKTNYDTGSNDNKEILKDIEKDISDTLGKAKKCRNYAERRALWSDLKTYKKELRIRERKIVQDLLVGANVILSTLHGAGSYELTSLYKEPTLNFDHDHPLFDTIIIDEVSQSLEPQCWIPLVNHLGCKRLVIAGDNMQLPPTVKSKDDLDALMHKLSIDGPVADLELTLFDRLIRDHNGTQFKKLLDTQYRMNEDIMRFPSNELYDGNLKAHDSVRSLTLEDLPSVKPTDDTSVPCVWYDTQGGDFPEKSSDDDSHAMAESTGSKYNDMEVLVVVQHLQNLLQAGMAPADIGIISPYNAQASLLKKTLQLRQLDGIEVSTVDGFQGREKEAIIISLVRSNSNREIGFLADRRRLNVAMTRPKKHLCIIGDLELMATNGKKYLTNWSQYAENEYEIRYPDLGDY